MLNLWQHACKQDDEGDPALVFFLGVGSFAAHGAFFGSHAPNEAGEIYSRMIESSEARREVEESQDDVSWDAVRTSKVNFLVGLQDSPMQEAFQAAALCKAVGSFGICGWQVATGIANSRGVLTLLTGSTTWHPHLACVWDLATELRLRSTQLGPWAFTPDVQAKSLVERKQ